MRGAAFASRARTRRWAPAALLAAAVLAAGCASEAVSPRLARYRPSAAAPQPAGRTAVLAASADAAPPSGRRLRRGDRIMISKRGIPQQEDVRDVIDERGNVNLSLVGALKIDGLTLSEAGAAIERAYVDGGYYKTINVVVVPELEYQYFVRGEIKAPGRYPLTAGLTLLRAITSAGGYTDFANPRKITVYRGNQVFRFSASRIESLKEADPPIEPEDVIVVGQTWLL